MKSNDTTIDELMQRDDVRKIDAAIDVLLDAMIAEGRKSAALIPVIKPLPFRHYR